MIRTQLQNTASPFVTTNEQPLLAPSTQKPKYKPQDQKQGGKKPRAPKNPIVQLEKVLAVWVWGTAVLGGAGCFWGAGAPRVAVSPLRGPTKNCGVLLREGCLWTGIGVLVMAEGGAEPQEWVPPPRGLGKQSLQWPQN